MKKIYLEYNKLNFKDFVKIVSNFHENKKSVYLKVLFDDKANLSKVFKYLKKMDFTKISFVIKNNNYSKKILKLINDKKTPLIVQFIIDNPLTKKDEKFFDLITKVERNFEVFDYSNYSSRDYFNKFKNVSYYVSKENKEENRLLYVYCNNGMSYCKNSSCLGKVLFIDKDGNVSFCPKYSKLTYLDKINNITNAEEIFDNETFVNYLENMINKREKCKENCEYFSKCKGGCPIEDSCETFKKNYLLAKTTINNILDNNINLASLPLSVKENILWLLCNNRK